MSSAVKLLKFFVFLGRAVLYVFLSRTQSTCVCVWCGGVAHMHGGRHTCNNAELGEASRRTPQSQASRQTNGTNRAPSRPPFETISVNIAQGLDMAGMGDAWLGGVAWQVGAMARLQGRSRHQAATEGRDANPGWSVQANVGSCWSGVMLTWQGQAWEMHDRCSVHGVACWEAATSASEDSPRCPDAKALRTVAVRCMRSPGL